MAKASLIKSKENNKVNKIFKFRVLPVSNNMFLTITFMIIRPTWFFGKKIRHFKELKIPALMLGLWFPENIP